MRVGLWAKTRKNAASNRLRLILYLGAFVLVSFTDRSIFKLGVCFGSRFVMPDAGVAAACVLPEEY